MPSVQDAVEFLRKTASYRRKYGVVRGMQVALQVRKAAYVAPAGQLVSIQTPDLPHPVELRARTSDASVFRTVFIEEDLQVTLDAPSLIVDAGAYIGLSSIYFATRYPRARVVALELEAENYALLRRNTSRYPNIVPLHTGLWSGTTRLKVANPAADKWSFRASEAERDCDSRGGRRAIPSPR